ncbi:MAG TPA: hypothetical protein VMC03_10880, partial [Streptosporangiaceae bacterium]|nr:hypothetical protein [Streptosporangiaceae bacterium]
METSEPRDWPGRGPDSPAGGQAGPGTRPAPEPGTVAAAAGPAPAARGLTSRPVVRHLALLAAYLVAGIALTWPDATYLTGNHLPAVRDVSGYVWDLWWTAHQVVHLSNPWFTGHMAAPVGIQLGFDTTMPLAG